MKCEHVKDLLLTDYFDGQMNADKKKELDQHLISCESCKKFAQVAQKTISDYSVPEISLDQDKIWHSIKENIESRQQSSSVFVNILNQLQQIFPKPALALGLTMILILFLTYSHLNGKNSQLTQSSSEEATNDLAYLSDIWPAEDNGDYGTDIEQYFL